MEKYIVVLRPGRSTSQPGTSHSGLSHPAPSHEELASHMRRFAHAIADHDAVTDVWFTHTVGPAPRSMLPLRNGPAGCVSVKVGSGEAAAGGGAGARIAANDYVDGGAAGAIVARRLLLEAGAPDLPGFSGIYRADEALPVRYDRDWPDGAQTPGVCLLTFFHRPPRLDYAKFNHRWHVGHTGLSLRLHPLWHYNRNVVEQVADPDVRRAAGAAGPARGAVGSGDGDTPSGARLGRGDSAPFDGIVEEHFRRREDLLNPFRFYGKFPAIVWNMLTILVDILGFIDLRRIETYLTRETIVQSSAEGAAHSAATAARPSRDRVPADPFPSES